MHWPLLPALGHGQQFSERSCSAQTTGMRQVRQPTAAIFSLWLSVGGGGGSAGGGGSGGCQGGGEPGASAGVGESAAESDAEPPVPDSVTC